MKLGDLQLKTTTGGDKYFILNERATKNPPGGTNDSENETVMMAWPENPRCFCDLCKKAGLAQVYTPHCIRATSVTVLKVAGLENCGVKSVTGHASDKSIESYSTRPTIE